MKYTIRITIGQYEYVETEVSNVDDIQPTYREVKSAINPPTDGLDAKSWRTALDGYLATGSMDSSDYSEMNKEQKTVIQEIKKSIKRQK